MFCGFCGQQLDKSDKYCPICGEATTPNKPVERIEPVSERFIEQKLEESFEEVSQKESGSEPIFGFLRNPRFWKVIGFGVVIFLVFIPSVIYLTSKPKSGDIILAESTPNPVTTAPSPKVSDSIVEPSPEIKTSSTPKPKTSKSPKEVKVEAKICRTIIQFGGNKQCFKLSETTELTVESKYGDCPILNANNGTCDVGSTVIVPTDRESVAKPCSPGGDINYSVNGVSGGIIGGGEPSSLRNQDCLNYSNNTLPFVLNYFPPLSFMKTDASITEVRYQLPEIGVEVIDEYIK